MFYVGHSPTSSFKIVENHGHIYIFIKYYDLDMLDEMTSKIDFIKRNLQIQNEEENMNKHSLPVHIFHTYLYFTYVHLSDCRPVTIHVTSYNVGEKGVIHHKLASNKEGSHGWARPSPPQGGPVSPFFD